jgi:hypothetical protein
LETKLREFWGDLDALKKDLTADPSSARALEQIISQGLADGLARKTIANRIAAVPAPPPPPPAPIQVNVTVPAAGKSSVVFTRDETGRITGAVKEELANG